MNGGIRVLVVSSDPGLAGALAALASESEEFDEVGHAPSPEGLEKLVRKWGPTVTVVSIHMPRFHDVLANLEGLTAILALDDAEDPEAMLDAIESGAAGYAVAGTGLGQLVDAIRTVASGRASIPPVLLGHLLRRVVLRRRAQREALEELEELTPREREVFELAARGYSHREVADKLFISPATSRTHLQRVFSKLDLHSRSELVAMAAQCGLEVGTLGDDET